MRVIQLREARDALRRCLAREGSSAAVTRPVSAVSDTVCARPRAAARAGRSFANCLDECIECYVLFANTPCTPCRPLRTGSLITAHVVSPSLCKSCRMFTTQHNIDLSPIDKKNNSLLRCAAALRKPVDLPVDVREGHVAAGRRRHRRLRDDTGEGHHAEAAVLDLRRLERLHAGRRDL